MDTLKKEIDQVIGNDIFDLEYKLRSTEMKLDNIYMKLLGNPQKTESPLTKASTLEARVTEISTIIEQMLKKLRGNFVFERNIKKSSYYDIKKSNICDSNIKKGNLKCFQFYTCYYHYSLE